MLFASSLPTTSPSPATSNESTSAAVKFILSPSTLTREISTDSSGILIRKNILSSNMSSAHTITTTQSISLPSTTVGYFGNVHNQELRRYQSVLLDQSNKAKRSAVKEQTISPECEPFTVGEEGSRTFYSPGYPGHYTKNISCVRVLEGEKICSLQFR